MDKARKGIGERINDPAGYKGDLSDYLDTKEKLEAVKSRMQTAYDRAVAAEELVKKGRVEEAFDKWRMIFGDSFPAHG